MKNIIYLSNTGVQLLCGEFDRNKISISHFQNYQLPEGTMLDGTIMEEEVIKDVLHAINSKGIDECKVVIDSGQTVHKKLVVPKIKANELQTIIREEIGDLDNNDQELIYDYAILNDDLGDNPGMEIICCGMKKEMIELYLNVFEEADIKINSIDISINALDKVIGNIVELADRNFGIAVLNGNDIALYLFENGEYVFNNRSRLFSQRGSSAFMMEVSNILSQFKQFIKTTEYNQNLEKIYFCGLDKYEEDMLFEVVSDSIDVELTRLANSGSVVYTGADKMFELHKYIYAAGSLFER